MGLVWFTQRALVRKHFCGAMSRTANVLLAGKLYEGTLWGALIWITIQTTTPAAATALVLALMAAISSNAVSLLSPMFGLYLALMLPMLSLAALRFFALDGLIYKAMGVCCLLYVVAQMGQARLIGRNLTDTIRLRFENLDLIESLRTEQALASQAREAAPCPR